MGHGAQSGVRRLRLEIQRAKTVVVRLAHDVASSSIDEVWVWLACKLDSLRVGAVVDEEWLASIVTSGRGVEVDGVGAMGKRVASGVVVGLDARDRGVGSSRASGRGNGRSSLSDRSIDRWGIVTCLLQGRLDGTLLLLAGGREAGEDAGMVQMTMLLVFLMEVLL